MSDNVYNDLNNKVIEKNWEEVLINKTSKRFLPGIRDVRIYNIIFEIFDTIDWNEILLNTVNEGFKGITIRTSNFLNFSKCERFLYQKPDIGENPQPIHHFEILNKYKEVVIDKICRTIGFDPEKLRYDTGDKIILTKPWKVEKNIFSKKFRDDHKSEENKHMSNELKKPILPNIYWNLLKPEIVIISFDYKSYLMHWRHPQKILYKNIFIFDCISNDIKEKYNISQEYLNELVEHP